MSERERSVLLRFAAVLEKLKSWIRAKAARVRLDVWHSPDYRLPLPGLEARIELRRADFALWALLERRVLSPVRLHAPPRISYPSMARVHDRGYLESLTLPATLGRIFAVDPSELVVDELMGAVRLACGGTLAAAREALRFQRATMNLLGGFHHAGRASGGGLCPVNDLAIAIAELRTEGFEGRVAILDLDAHPPDGTADCLARDPRVWIGSLSGAHWGPLPDGVDETVITGADDQGYLAALESLLTRMPPPALAFVIAGGDVLAGDRMGRLGMSLQGVFRRDRMVAAALQGRASVWLPGGGYQPEAWKVLVGSACALVGPTPPSWPRGHDPMRARFSAIAAGLDPSALRGELTLTLEDLENDLGGGPSAPRLLGYYGPTGVEHALHEYGILDQLHRIGYAELRVVLDQTPGGDRLRVLGRASGVADGRLGGREDLLLECVLARRQVAGASILFVEWLTLRNPRARFGPSNPRLPGQEVPGLGLAREVSQLLEQVALRLGLAGVGFRPAWLHTAWAGRHRLRFVDPARQGRFRALLRDLAALPLGQAARAVADGRVLLDGAAYQWEADDMVAWIDGREPDAAARALEEDVFVNAHFEVVP